MKLVLAVLAALAALAHPDPRGLPLSQIRALDQLRNGPFYTELLSVDQMFSKVQERNLALLFGADEPELASLALRAKAEAAEADMETEEDLPIVAPTEPEIQENDSQVGLAEMKEKVDAQPIQPDPQETPAQPKNETPLGEGDEIPAKPADPSQEMGSGDAELQLPPETDDKVAEEADNEIKKELAKTIDEDQKIQEANPELLPVEENPEQLLDVVNEMKQKLAGDTPKVVEEPIPEAPTADDSKAPEELPPSETGEQNTPDSPTPVDTEATGEPAPVEETLPEKDGDKDAAGQGEGSPAKQSAEHEVPQVGEQETQVTSPEVGSPEDSSATKRDAPSESPVTQETPEEQVVAAAPSLEVAPPSDSETVTPGESPAVDLSKTIVLSPEESAPEHPSPVQVDIGVPAQEPSPSSTGSEVDITAQVDHLPLDESGRLRNGTVTLVDKSGKKKALLLGFNKETNECVCGAWLGSAAAMWLVMMLWAH